jgi:hypothetical protein
MTDTRKPEFSSDGFSLLWLGIKWLKTPGSSDLWVGEDGACPKLEFIHMRHHGRIVAIASFHQYDPEASGETREEALEALSDIIAKLGTIVDEARGASYDSDLESRIRAAAGAHLAQLEAELQQERRLVRNIRSSLDDLIGLVDLIAKRPSSTVNLGKLLCRLRYAKDGEIPTEGTP